MEEEHKPKIEELPDGVRVTCTCGNQVEVHLVASSQPKPKWKWQWGLYMFLAGAAGAAWGALSPRFLPARVFVAMTTVLMSWLAWWCWTNMREASRINKEAKEMEEQAKRRMAEFGQKMNSRWQ